MKKKILCKCMNLVKAKYPEYNQEKLEEIEYGLEAIYLTFTKLFVVLLLALILKILKEVLLILLSYNLLRTTAFGMHAKKSWQCYVISITLFIGGGFICKYIPINFNIKSIISLFCFISIILYAPADTYKRPLINARKRKIYKFISIISSFTYLILILIFNDNSISNYLFMGLLDATLVIHPITYRMFHLPYDNYKTYNSSYN